MDLFAATPPLGALKLLLSNMMTEGIGLWEGESYVMDFIDIRKAYFHAKAARDVYIELPDEDRRRNVRQA